MSGEGLEPDLARGALATLGARLDLDPVHTADAVLQVATASIYAALVPQLARRGVEASDYSLLAYGAAGPTHVFMLARDLDMRRVIVPPAPGTLCALGCIAADFRADFVRSVWHECAELDSQDLRAIYRALERDAREWLAEQRVALDHVYLLRSADMCYSGQSYEIGVELPEAQLDRLDSDSLVGWFHARYERLYGYANRGAPVRLLEARVQAVGVTERPQFRQEIRSIGTDAVESGAPTEREVFDLGRRVRARVHQRAQLREGERLHGPLVIEQYDTTVYVPEGFRVQVDEYLNLIGELDT